MAASVLSRRAVCWGRGIRLVDFVMSKGEGVHLLGCILPRISRLREIIGVGLLLFLFVFLFFALR